MDCRTAEGMVNRYINHTLSIEDLENFLKHIETCSSCYDELKTYFIVHEVTQQLNQDEEEQVLDFKELLEQDIKKSKRYILKKKISRFVAGFLICILIGMLASFLIYVILKIINVLS